METRCEASLTWERPERFARVCPLLKRNAAGELRCSVDTPKVRPFWLRALAFYGGGLLAVYLLVTLAIFGVRRAVGYKIDYWTIAWPPAWKTMPNVKSEFFTNKARTALAANNINEAVISLSLAYQLNPQNYSAGFTLAQLSQVSQPGMADRVYGQLLRDHPKQRPATLTAWYQALLLRGDFPAIVLLCVDALKIDPPHAGAWTHGLVFALRREPQAADLGRLLNDPELPAETHAVLSLEKLTTGGSDETRRAVLLQPPAIRSAYMDYYRVRRLIELGAANDALKVLQSVAPRLQGRDHVALQLDAHAALGMQSILRTETEALLRGEITAPLIEALCVHLIRNPNTELVKLVFARLREKPFPANEANYSLYTSLLCAAGVSGDQRELRELIATTRQIVGGDYKSLSAVEAFFRDRAGSRIEPYLPILQPLPIEVTYALLERFYRPRTPSP